MICRNCTNAITGQTKGDKEMAMMKYRICRLARNEVERATYILGDTECMWPERLKQNNQGE